MSNRLARETSPYLLQHRNNPVDWYPWGEEAFAEARASNRPVLLSVGYSACHWCHVMERESFEDTRIAGLMNDLFVNIKVDREERPDVDAIYMAAVQQMTGHGGWPMTVFLTPDGKPFYGGTYFPNEDRGGLPAFPRLLEAVSDAFHDKEQQGRIQTTASELVSAISLRAQPRHSEEPLTLDLVTGAAQSFIRGFDEAHGGMGVQPKFPQPMVYELLLRNWRRTGDEESLRMVEVTLEKMARGGIYDQIGGGFARYSTDMYWLVPHFEKMLYDNAQLTSLYLHAWQVTGKPLYRRVVEETLHYVLNEMTHASGGFYSSQDADSEGEEGKFYVWVPEEVDQALGDDLARVAKAYWGVSREGNFEGKSILHVPEERADVTARPGVGDAEHDAMLQAARTGLYEARSRRVWPDRDEKILTSWNALMMKAFAECGAVLGVPEWVDAACRNADFVLERLRRGGRLLRTWKDDGSGGPGRLNGYLEDYAGLADALITLYEATFDQRWLTSAGQLADEMIDLFWSDEDRVFYDTGKDHEKLVVRPRDVFDNAIPSGGSLAAQALVRLAVFTGHERYTELAMSSMRPVRDYMASAPEGVANWLCALDFSLAKKQEVVILGPGDDARTRALVEAARRGYSPNRVLAGAEASVSDVASPLLQGRELVKGLPTAFVCENYVCQLPVTDVAALEAQLTEAAVGGPSVGD